MESHKPKQTSTVYHLKHHVKKLLHDDTDDSYMKILPFLQLFKKQNVGAVVALEVDSVHRFMQCFMASPVASMACGQNGSCKKVLGADGTHYRHPKYNGVLLSMHTIDGNGRTMLVAVTIVPVESEQHWHWFFNLCKNSGVYFEDKVLFVDRDKGSIAAGLQMAMEGTQLNMRWCTQHILRNCINKLGVSTNDVQFRAYVFALQASKSILEHRKHMK